MGVAPQGSSAQGGSILRVSLAGGLAERLPGLLAITNANG